jgi:NADH dehydrogenase FAD-containing subunit
MLSIAVVGGGPTGVEFAGIYLCIVNNSIEILIFELPYYR